MTGDEYLLIEIEEDDEDGFSMYVNIVGTKNGQNTLVLKAAHHGEEARKLYSMLKGETPIC